MDDRATAFGLFQFFYQATNLVRMVQHGRSNPDDVRKIIADAVALGKSTFPQHASGLDAAAAEYERAIQHGLTLRAEQG